MKQVVIQDVEPRQGLLEEILVQAKRQDAHLRARRRFWAFLLLLSVSVALSVPVSMSLSAELRRSGFTAFLSLLTTDGADVLAHWREFAYSLLESLPIAQLIASLGLCMAGLYASRSVMRESRNLAGRTTAS